MEHISVLTERSYFYISEVLNITLYFTSPEEKKPVSRFFFTLLNSRHCTTYDKVLGQKLPFS